mgnify:FL=1
MRTVLLAKSPLEQDPRPRRMVRWLQEAYDNVSFIGNKTDLKKLNYIKKLNLYELQYTDTGIINKFKKALYFLLGLYSKLERQFKDIPILDVEKNHLVNLEQKFDVVVCSDLVLLPLAFKIKKPDGKIFFDAREFYPRQYEDRLIWRLTLRKLNIFLCKKYLKKIDSSFTVGKGLQKGFKDVFDIETVYLPGYSEKSDIEPKITQDENINLIYHGNTNPSRGTELLIEIMEHLPSNYHLYLYLMTDYSDNYSKSIKNLVETKNNVTIKEPVPSQELISMGNSYDLGLAIYKPSNFNLRNGLPNKMFEYIQSKIGVVCGLQKEIGDYIDKYKIGINVGSNDPKKIANEISKIDRKKINEIKRNAVSASLVLNSETTKEIFIKELKKG